MPYAVSYATFSIEPAQDEEEREPKLRDCFIIVGGVGAGVGGGVGGGSAVQEVLTEPVKQFGQDQIPP